MDNIYKKFPLDKIPWNSETPPQVLVDFLKSGVVKPCKALDIGCGAGNYAIYLAELGFDVTGCDISPTAIRLAKENAAKKGVTCNFVAADVITVRGKLGKDFDFAYDWEVLHHIYPDDRAKYIRNVHSLLVPGGYYLSISFSEKDTQFTGSEKYRKTPIGTVLYFSSEEELRELFDPHFTILELKTIEVPGKIGPHMVNFAFMRKK